MDRKKIRILFNSCAAAVENVADTKITTREGQLEEIGVCLAGNSLITYDEKNDEIHFYDENNNLLLSLDSNSYLLFMMQELMYLEKDYREG